MHPVRSATLTVRTSLPSFMRTGEPVNQLKNNKHMKPQNSSVKMTQGVVRMNINKRTLLP